MRLLISARNRNGDLERLLRGRGHAVEYFPQASPVIPASLGVLPAGTSSVAFLDVITTAEVMQRPEFASHLDEVVVCALDSQVLEALRDCGVHADVVPLTRTAPGVYRSLDSYFGTAPAGGGLLLVGGSPRLTDAVIDMFMVAESERFGYVASLGGWEQTHVDARSRALLLGGAYDGIVLSGPADSTDFELFIDTELTELSGAVDVFTDDLALGEILTRHGLSIRSISLL
jgi:hypothetical protein